jgi:hypothetical protein
MMSLPAICGASTVTFEGNTLLFDPRGCTPSNLPSPCFYRAYDCKIGGKFTLPKVVFPNTPGNNNKGDDDKPPSNNPPKQDFPPNNPPGNSGPDTPPVNPPQGEDDKCDHGDRHCAAVPAPDSAAMGGVGVVAIGLFAWVKTRRQARA